MLWEQVTILWIVICGKGSFAVEKFLLGRKILFFARAGRFESYKNKCVCYFKSFHCFGAYLLLFCEQFRVPSFNGYLRK